MTNEQKIYAALAVLVALGAGVFYVQRKEKNDDAAHVAGAASANLPEFKLPSDDVDKVTKIHIKNADKTDVTLEKTGNDWRVTAPVDYPANQQNVKSLLDNLKELKPKDLIDPSPQAYAEFGLDDAKALHVEAWKGDMKAVDLWFGKSGGRGQMTRKAGQDGVYAVSGYSAYLYTREVKGWRDTTIVKFDDANAVAVDIKNENGDFAFRKDGDNWSGKYKGNTIDRFDDGKVKDLLRAYKTLNAEDFADGKSDAETGLDKPASELTITLKEGEPVKIVVGKTSSGESRYVKKVGNPQVFVMSSWAAGWAMAKEDKFQKPDTKDGGTDKKDGGSDKKK